MPSIKQPRGTRSALQELASNGGVVEGQIYSLTDENRIAIGVSPTAFQAFLKEGEGGGGGGGSSLIRITRDELVVLGDASNITPDQLYLITGEDLLAVGLTPTTFQAFEAAPPPSLRRVAVLGPVNTVFSGGTLATFGLTGLDLREGDFLILQNAGVTSTSSAPNASVVSSGWTEQANLFANDSRDATLFLATKFMGSTPDTSVTIDQGFASTVAAYSTFIMVYRGVDPANPIDGVIQTSALGNTSNVTLPAISTSAPSSVIVQGGVGSYTDAGVPHGFPAIDTQLNNAIVGINTDGSSSSYTCSTFIGERSGAVPEITINHNVTISLAANAGYSLALRSRF